MAAKSPPTSKKADLEKILNDHKKILTALRDRQQALLIEEQLMVDLDAPNDGTAQ